MNPLSSVTLASERLMVDYDPVTPSRPRTVSLGHGSAVKRSCQSISVRAPLRRRSETNFTDVSGTGRLLGQVAGRTGNTVTGWLDDHGQAWNDQVGFVAIDLCAVYRLAVGRALPDTVIVVDHFHLVRLANQAVTRGPPAGQPAGAGTARHTTRDPAWANRRRLLRGRESLSSE